MTKRTRTSFHHGLTFWIQGLTGLALSSLTLALLTLDKLGVCAP